jgi:solute carrier family 41
MLGITKEVMYDCSLLLQSTPSLFISLISLLITGDILENTVKDIDLEDYHLLLQSNCILNFKGNIELIYALYISSMRQSRIFMFKKYVRYAFDNANILMLQSIVIGLSVGSIGASKSIFVNGVNPKVLSTIMTSSLITCISTTLMFIICLFVTIEISKKSNIDPENVLLPMISSLSDFLSIYFLVFFTKYFRNISIEVSLFLVLMSLVFVPICMTFTFFSKKKMPIQTIEILMFTYLISTLGGYILDTLSVDYKFIASSFPVYSGLAVSIAFIYLHKTFTSSTNNTFHDIKRTFKSLIAASFFMITIYSILSMFLHGIMPLYYYIMFTILFVIQVILLLKLVEKLILSFGNYHEDIGVISLPIITACGDIISTVCLLILALMVKMSKIF